jgi:hypothetical protein
MSMDNPYQSPMAPLGPADPMDPFQRGPGLARHVRVVAILMMVQAVLELLAAAGLGAMAAYMPIVFRQMQQVQKPPAAVNQPEIWIVPLIYGGMAAAALAAGVLHLVAGLRNYRFRGRTLGIVALSCGMLTFFTCYCLPTAVALGVYGLIVYLNRGSSAAFQMGKAGYKPAEIIATFFG